MDIPIHAHVTCSDGLVGKSSYIVVDLITERVTHFVVKTKELDGLYLVPLEMVADTDRSNIYLNCTKEDVYALRPFEESFFNGFDSYNRTPPLPTPGVDRKSTLYHPYRTADATTQDASTYSSVVELAVNKGAMVLATDARVGEVDELVIDSATHRVTHLVLRQHHLFKDKAITIPVSAIEKAEVDTVFLKIDKEAVEALPTVDLKKFPWE